MSRLLGWTGTAFGSVALAGLAAGYVARGRELDSARRQLRDVRAELARQETGLKGLETDLARRDDHSLLERRREAAANEAVLSRLARAQGDEVAGLKTEVTSLEARLATLATALEAQARELERARNRASLDLAVARRELLSPTVRVNARSEVGSGTLIFSRPDAKGFRHYVLTAWHIVRDNVQAQGGPLPVEVDVYDDGKKVADHRAAVVARHEPLDLALLELESDKPVPVLARLATRRALEQASVFSRVYAVGCPLGYAPIQTPGEITSREKELDGATYWMVNAPTIFGNSGGGIYLTESRELIGVLSRISAYKNLIDVAVPHMGIVTPITAVYDWLDRTDYAFIGKEVERVDGAEATKVLPASARKPREK